jgi:hypothetical protein
MSGQYRLTPLVGFLSADYLSDFLGSCQTLLVNSLCRYSWIAPLLVLIVTLLSATCRSFCVVLMVFCWTALLFNCGLL